MLLTIDLGNTQTMIGLYQGEHLCADWRLSTQPTRSADEWASSIAAFLSIRKIDREAVEDAVMCSVVPPLTGVIVEMIQSFFGKQPLEVGPGTKTGIRILYDNPLEVGADRIANSVAALEMGITRFDGAVGGLGGCPYAPGASGNVPTEHLVYAFEKMGVDTGIQLEKLIEAALFI